MKKKLKSISSQLKKASKAHAGQAAKIDKLIKPKFSKLHKTQRRLVKPKESEGGKFGKVAGKVGAGLGILGNVIDIAQQLKKKPKVQKPKKPVEPVAGRVQKPYLSKKKPKKSDKPVIDKKLIKEAEKNFKVRSHKTQGDSIYLTKTMKKMGSIPGRESSARLDLYEKYGSKGGMQSKAERIKANKEKLAAKKAAVLAKRRNAKMSMKKPKLMGGPLSTNKTKGGLNFSVGPGLAKIAALGGLAYLFFGNKKKSKKK